MMKLRKWLAYQGKTVWGSITRENMKPKGDQMLFDFRKEEAFKKWTCSSDSLFGGKTDVQLTRSPGGSALFTGITSTDTSANEAAKYFGFASMKSDEFENAWDSPEPLNITEFDGIEIKYRGDGRAYTVNIEPKVYGLPVNNDSYQAIVFTRGGPHWEVNRISFAYFILTCQGYLQDDQFTAFHNINRLSLSVHDRNNGPFRLEIDYIKLIQTGCQPFNVNRVHKNTYKHLLPAKPSS